jgi:hypothetical protein|uniref:Forkhead-associated n=2 Tax=Phyllobacteriaceae TaxID=69277 RepID=Q11M69_CHESB
MIVAKLSRAGCEDRFFSLDPGEYRLGSDFNCEIALIHSEIAPEHLMLKVGEGSASVLLKPGSAATFFNHAAQRNLPLSQEEWTPWRPGDRLVIADIFLELDGVKAEEPDRGESAGKPVKRRVSRKIALAAAALAVLAGIGNSLFTRELEGSTMARADQEQAGRTDPAPVAGQACPDDAALARILQFPGARIERLGCSGGNCSATLRASDAAVRERVQAKLTDTRTPLAVDIFVDSEIAEAAKLIIASLGVEARVLGNKDGVITLSAICDRELRKRLAGILKADVPGIAEVRFQPASPADLDTMAKRVVALWPGAYPYVVTDDGTVVRPGEQLGQNSRLVEVTGQHLLVEIDGQRQKVVVK